MPHTIQPIRITKRTSKDTKNSLTTKINRIGAVAGNSDVEYMKVKYDSKGFGNYSYIETDKNQRNLHNYKQTCLCNTEKFNTLKKYCCPIKK